VCTYFIYFYPDCLANYSLVVCGFVLFLLRTAHDNALGKQAESPEVTMKAQIKQLVVQIEIGENAKKDVGPSSHHGGLSALHHGLRMPFIAPGMFGGTNAVSDW
jgi:hypothetical protein